MKLAIQGGGSLEVSDDTFGSRFNEALVHQVLTAYMVAGRAGTKAQKTRAEVRGGGRKPWKQKGSGRARAGTSRSPIWTGGGVTFAGKPRDHSQKVNRRMYQGAMRAVLSELVRQNRLVVVPDLTLREPRTRELVAWLREIGHEGGLIIVDRINDNLRLSARNLPGVEVLDTDHLNPASLIRHDAVLVTSAAIKRVEERLS